MPIAPPIGNMLLHYNYDLKSKYDVLPGLHGPLASVIPPTTIESSHRGRTHGGSCMWLKNIVESVEGSIGRGVADRRGMA